MTDKLFKVVGVSTHKGFRKVRYAQDLNRILVLNRFGDTDIKMFELPEAMTKSQALKHALDNNWFTLDNTKQHTMSKIIAKIKKQTSVEDVLSALT